MHREIDDHADIRHPWRKRSDAGNGDRENVLILDGALDRLNRGVEALDMAYHQRDAGPPRGGDNGAAFLHCGSNRLLHHHVDATGGAIDCYIPMKVGRRGNGDEDRG